MLAAVALLACWIPPRWVTQVAPSSHSGLNDPNSGKESSKAMIAVSSSKPSDQMSLATAYLDSPGVTAVGGAT